ncbi:hypothetical protein KBZ21_18260 [Streptomyces sp. A73]|uniref:hypothetical protein n=1 Tax=Streptomyces sp. B15 TaxID=1537797 RepID=UPI001B384961|nr:hypothetical protein [Streptomyces sp. B15]MBQ1123027.1 hypothetical protein [Streptomyces sp. B15]MBQ1160029.1 hypothetical protein [Streptomyces sp. A73]
MATEWAVTGLAESTRRMVTGPRPRPPPGDFQTAHGPELGRLGVVGGGVPGSGIGLHTSVPFG